MSPKALWRHDDAVWRQLPALFSEVSTACGLRGCRGFSRQAMGDIAAAFAGRAPAPMSRLRHVVRDLVLQASLEEMPPVKITSAAVRAYLELHLGQTQADRDAYTLAWVLRQFEGRGLSGSPAAREGVAA